MIALLAVLALAQEPAPEPQPGGDGVDASVEEGVLVVRVFGPDAIREARRKIVDDMEKQGWRVVSSHDGEVVFRGPSNWMGRAILDPAGTMSFTTAVAAYSGVGVDDASVGRDTPGDAPIAQESPGGDYQAVARDPGEEIVPQVSFALFPARKAAKIHDRVLAEVGPELAEYRDTLQETLFQEQLEQLSDRLDALWELGLPLEEGQPHIDTIDERRKAVLEFWATRSNTHEGIETCRAVELWLARVVQPSADPVTAPEQEQANAEAQHGRRLALITP
jgi:hypothetical protein